MIKEHTKEDHARMIKYFWDEKGDVTRYVYWDECKHLFPDVEKAVRDYEYSLTVLKLVIGDLEETDHD